MENKELKGLITALEKVSGEQKRVTGALLEKLEIITDSLIDIIKEHDLEDNLKRFDYANFGFRIHESNLGKYIHFCNIDQDYEYYSKILPNTTEKINTDFYYHNDFNSPTNYMSRSEVLNASNIMIDFIKNMTAKIQSLTDKEQKFIDQFANIQ